MNGDNDNHSDPPTKKEIDASFDRLIENAKLIQDLGNDKVRRLTSTWEFIRKNVCRKCGVRIDMSKGYQHSEPNCGSNRDVYKFKECKHCGTWFSSHRKLRRHEFSCKTRTNSCDTSEESEIMEGSRNR